MEPAVGQSVGHLLEQGLLAGLPTPESVEPHYLSIEVHLRPDQPMQPLAVHLEPAVQQLHPPQGIGPPNGDDPPPGPGLEVQLPPLGNGAPSRGRLNPIGPVATMGGHEAGRVALQVRQVRVLEPSPDLRLPGPLVALDDRLEPRRAGRAEDRGDPQAQAQPRDPAEGVGMGMRPLEARVVVELAVARQPDRLPVLDQARDHESGGEARSPGPGDCQAAVQRDAVEDFDLGTVLDDQPLDHVDAVQFLPPSGDLGQIPTGGRGATPHASLSVEDTAAAEDPCDGSHRGEPLDLAGREDLMDRLSSMESQVTGLLQFATHGQDLLLDGGLRAVRVTRTPRAIVPIDAIQPLAFGPLDPVMDSVRAHAELADDLAERSTAADGSDHGPTAGGLTVSLVMVHLSRGRRFPSSLPAKRSGCSVTQAFGMLCHLPSYLRFARVHGRFW